MFDRAVEMSRGAAVAELVGEDFQDCELGYRTSIMLLEAVLENDDEPLMRRPSAKRDKSADEIINGMESEDRQTVVKLIDGTRARLSALRKKIHAAQVQQKRASFSDGRAPRTASSPTMNAHPPTYSGSSPR